MISGYTETFGAMIVLAANLISNNPVYDIEPNQINKHETFCLAQNIWFEARNTSTEDRILVGLTTLNRVRDSRYSETICEVARQGIKNDDGSMKRNACQFSWYCDGKPDSIDFNSPVDVRIWNEIVEIAILLQVGYIEDISDGATHYHAHYVNPDWARKKVRLASTVGHKFYKSVNYEVFMSVDDKNDDSSFAKRVKAQMMENMFTIDRFFSTIRTVDDTPPTVGETYAY